MRRQGCNLEQIRSRCIREIHHHHHHRVHPAEGNTSHISVRHLIQTDSRSWRVLQLQTSLIDRQFLLIPDQIHSYTPYFNPETDPRSVSTQQPFSSKPFIMVLLFEHTAETAAVVMLHLSMILHVNKDDAAHKREEILTRVSAPESLTSPAGLSWLC